MWCFNISEWIKNQRGWLPVVDAVPALPHQGLNPFLFHIKSASPYCFWLILFTPICSSFLLFLFSKIVDWLLFSIIDFFKKYISIELLFLETGTPLYPGDRRRLFMSPASFVSSMFQTYLRPTLLADNTHLDYLYLLPYSSNWQDASWLSILTPPLSSLKWRFVSIYTYAPTLLADKTRPDYLTTVDTDPASPSYSQVKLCRLDS